MRKGPYPLSVHIGMAVSSWPVLNDQKDIELVQDMTLGINKMLQGIQLYHDNPYTPERAEQQSVWQKGTVNIYKYGENIGNTNVAPVLLVPSLINGSSILDLCPERSFAQWLSNKGIPTYLLDWGEITEDREQSSMDALIVDRLVPAIEFLSKLSRKPVNILGYCMGGTMSIAAALHTRECVDKMILLAAPWDFHGGSQALLQRVQYWAPSAMTYIDLDHDLPVEGIQTLFASLDPAMAARKFIRFADLPGDGAEAKLFIAVEDWLNDGRALPAQVAKHCIEEWFFENKPGREEWNIGETLINPAALDKDCLVVTSRKDKLVEYDCASALSYKMPRAEILDTDCGHIGMIAGKNSISSVWEPIADWCLQKG